METTVSVTASEAGRAPWLLFIPRLPAKPDYLRVKLQRRVRRLGAKLVKNAVYVLRSSDEALEDFVWLRRELVADGGDAIICEASFIQGMTDEEAGAMWQEGGATLSAGGAAGAEVVPRGTTWVTRRGVGVDRMASAWLIRRFIDPEARFRFVEPTGYRPSRGEVRFDMYEGEYTHEGEACTFEALVRRFRLERPGLSALGEIVHDIDCKDSRYGRAESGPVSFVVDSIRDAHSDDDVRLERAMPFFDDLLVKVERPDPVP